LLARHQIDKYTRLQSQLKLTPPYGLPGVEKAADSTFTVVEKAISLQGSKEQRRLITPSVVLIIKSGRIKSQDLSLNDIKSCMVTLLLARTYYSIACSTFGVCSEAFIHSQQSTLHGATSFKRLVTP
jgi:hypothetical protein